MLQNKILDCSDILLCSGKKTIWNLMGVDYNSKMQQRVQVNDNSSILSWAHDLFSHCRTPATFVFIPVVVSETRLRFPRVSGGICEVSVITIPVQLSTADLLWKTFADCHSMTLYRPVALHNTEPRVSKHWVAIKWNYAINVYACVVSFWRHCLVNCIAKKALREMQTLRPGCSNAEPKISPHHIPPSRGCRTAKI